MLSGCIERDQLFQNTGKHLNKWKHLSEKNCVSITNC